MAKKAIVVREQKRIKLTEKFRERREQLKKIIKKATNYEEVDKAQNALANLPLNSNPVRVTRRCQQCGRAHAVYRKFQLCRICVRKYFGKGEITGCRKSSW